jgi:hypothetical protein
VPFFVYVIRLCGQINNKAMYTDAVRNDPLPIAWDDRAVSVTDVGQCDQRGHFRAFVNGNPFIGHSSQLRHSEPAKNLSVKAGLPLQILFDHTIGFPRSRGELARSKNENVTEE